MREFWPLAVKKNKKINRNGKPGHTKLLIKALLFNQTDCKAGTTAEGQNLLANISTSRARRLALLVEILANKFCPSAVVPALQSVWFYNT